ncbi:MAG TPA: NADH-quinone oxidoreductase subunit N [Candidatus Acidoferrales bacterium]|nr:NADH-quinone oxidoreductase subunit N [Candidatus Acidoferrales bacterium]
MTAGAPVLLRVDLWALGPVIALTLGALVLLLLELVPPRERGNRGGIVSLLALGASAWAVLRVAHAKRSIFGGMFVHDPMTVFFTLLFCAIGILSVLASWDYVKRTRINQAEYYALLLSSVLGMIVMAASNDLVTIFLGLELMSLSLYVMVGFRRTRLDSNEAALKYFLLGAFASGFLLYGIALLYGATGTTQLGRMGAFLAYSPLLQNPLLLVGALLVFSGFAFKVAAVPFHMWTPDAYEGAPTSVTGFMSAGAKAAGFAALLRVGLRALGPVQADWTPLLAVIAFLTMTVGNLTALLQNNLKRMLAYSSIAHAGYVLVAVAAGGPEGAAAAVFYLAVYSFMNLGAFTVLTMLGEGRDERVLVSDLAGLGFRQPLLGIAMTVFMISLGGIPPTAGFMGKILVFGAALQKPELGWLVIAGVLNSVVSVFYYLRVTVALYMREPEGEPVHVSWGPAAALAILLALAATLYFGVQSHGLWQQAKDSINGLL